MFSRLLLMLAALIVSAAQHPNPPGRTQQLQAARTSRPAQQKVGPTTSELTERAHRAKYEAECDPEREKRDSDLCAQWKAADAADDAAWWAARSTWVGAVSGVLVLIALGFAFEANKIARDTAKRQLRAYIEMRPIEITGIGFGDIPTITATFINTGQTPARNLCFGLGWRVGSFEENEEFFKIDFSGTAVSRGQVGSHQTRTITRDLEGITEAHKAAIEAEELALWAYGLITYDDIFGRGWKTPFRFLYRPSYLRSRFIYAAVGNEAT